jgi:hypothetical protein
MALRRGDLAKVTHATGELEIMIEDLAVEDSNLVILGKLGVWRAKIAVPPPEVIMIMRLLFKPSVLAYVLSLPFRRRRRVPG